MAEEGGSAGGSGGSGGTVKIPGLGPMKKVYVYTGLALVVGIVGYAYWSKSKGDDTVYLDPAELPYGAPVDTNASPTTSGLSYNNEYDDDPTFGAPRTNNEWSDRAISRMEWLSYDGQTVAVAIGKYLARQQLSQAEADMIRTIHGLIGRPPEGDYPILVAPTPPTTNPPPTPEVKPYKVFWNGKPVWAGATWALAGGSTKWKETTSQATANSWAAQHETDRNADELNDASWASKKAEYLS